MGLVRWATCRVYRLKAITHVISGGLCGSAFLDVAFTQLIETLVGETQFRGIKASYRKRMMKEFEYGIKRCFSGRNDPEYSVELRGVKDDPENGIVDDTIVIKP